MEVPNGRRLINSCMMYPLRYKQGWHGITRICVFTRCNIPHKIPLLPGTFLEGVLGYLGVGRSSPVLHRMVPYESQRPDCEEVDEECG